MGTTITWASKRKMNTAWIYNDVDGGVSRLPSRIFPEWTSPIVCISATPIAFFSPIPLETAHTLICRHIHIACSFYSPRILPSYHLAAAYTESSRGNIFITVPGWQMVLDLLFPLCRIYHLLFCRSLLFLSLSDPSEGFLHFSYRRHIWGGDTYFVKGAFSVRAVHPNWGRGWRRMRDERREGRD